MLQGPRVNNNKTTEAYLSERDDFVSATTGVAKSLAFELAPYAFDSLLGDYSNASETRSSLLLAG